MTTHTPAPAPQEAVQALRDLRLGVEMDRHNLDDGNAKLRALDAAIELLSKLRAPVADERAARAEYDRGFSNGWDHGNKHGREQGFNGGICVALQVITTHDQGTIWSDIVRACDTRKMLDYAANVEPDEWELAGFKKYARLELNERKPRKRHVPASPLASAPVAGEAQPVGRVRHFSYSGIARNGFSQEAVLNDDAPSLPDGTLLYAAPQASEAVAILAEIAEELDDPTLTSFGQVATGIRDLKERMGQASEAVKQPACHVGHANFTPFYLLANLRRICTPALARRENWVLAIELFAVGGTTARRICREAGIDPDGKTVTRAALSAQPGAQMNGGSDAE